jgi:DNA-binding CsgD family transcriptional regulator/tetratricopeptide (TPR) repeat protein
MAVLERDGLLAQLQGQWRDACAGPGRLVFVEGEAGIGKTTLLRAFERSLRGEAPVHWGSCDALATPRAAGPIHDIAAPLPALTRSRLLATAGDRHRAFVAFVDLLAERPSLAVIEDLHWADEATLDLLRFAGRRIAHTRSLLLASYRSDELVPAHPLRAVLGDLATSGVMRVEPQPLSVAAVASLAQASGVDARELHRRTGGNPFFVTEVIASGEPGVPATVQDAVLARASRLSISARAVLDAAAVAGPRVEPWLLQMLTAAESTSIDECLATGVLCHDGTTFAFRHELARQAVLQAMTPTRLVSLHRLALDALQSPSASAVDAARLAHHADGAGDAPAVRRWAATAAGDAAAQGAHRQAAELWALALKHATTDAQCAPLIDAYALECRVCGRLADAVLQGQRAVQVWRHLGNTMSAAMALARLGMWLVVSARKDEGEAAMRDALARIAAPNAEPAAVIVVQRHAAAMHMMNSDTEQAIALAREVLRRAEQAGDGVAIDQAHLIIGSALLSGEHSAEGLDHLQRALAGAQARGPDTAVASTLLNLGSGCAQIHRLDLAECWLLQGIAHCAERDIDLSRLYQLSWLALVRLHQGRWDEARRAADDVLADGRAAPIARVMALVALGRLRARRGEPGVWAALDEARELAERSGALQRLVPMRCARAEAAWLEGRDADAAREAEAVLPLARSKGVAVFTAELLLWCRRGGRDEIAIPPSCAAHPFALDAAGRSDDAAQAWDALQCPYEAACALAASADPQRQCEALARLDALDARPMAERTRRRLRAAGARGVPRGPRASTLQHPAGLTSKEIAVLSLLATGLRNKEIAHRLSRSPRTIDHQVESIFAKLGVATRSEAVSTALRLGISVVDPHAPAA